MNLLLAILITTSLTAIGNYYLDQKDIQEHLDTLMAVSALSYQALLGDDLSARPLAKIQKDLENIPKKIEVDYPRPHLYEQPPNIISINLISKSGQMGKTVIALHQCTKNTPQWRYGWI